MLNEFFIAISFNCPSLDSAKTAHQGFTAQSQAWHPSVDPAYQVAI